MNVSPSFLGFLPTLWPCLLCFNTGSFSSTQSADHLQIQMPKEAGRRGKSWLSEQLLFGGTSPPPQHFPQIKCGPNDAISQFSKIFIWNLSRLNAYPIFKNEHVQNKESTVFPLLLWQCCSPGLLRAFLMFTVCWGLCFHTHGFNCPLHTWMSSQLALELQNNIFSSLLVVFIWTYWRHVLLKMTKTAVVTFLLKLTLLQSQSGWMSQLLPWGPSQKPQLLLSHWPDPKLCWF